MFNFDPEVCFLLYVLSSIDLMMPRHRRVPPPGGEGGTVIIVLGPDDGDD